MIINLKEIFDIAGERKSIDYKIPPDELSEIRDFSFVTPVHIKGEVKNRAGIVSLEFSLDFTLGLSCDRCLKKFNKDYHYNFQHTVVLSANEDNYEYIIAENKSIDLNDIAVSDLLLELPSKILCSDDCKGLCMICGCDLNESECNCQK